MVKQTKTTLFVYESNILNRKIFIIEKSLSKYLKISIKIWITIQFRELIYQYISYISKKKVIKDKKISLV